MCGRFYVSEETALEKKTFRDSVRHRRCVIPARQFYEWDASKNKVSFFKEESPILYMAGFYNWFEEEMRFIILTTQANASVSPVHNRMPLVLEENELETWVMIHLQSLLSLRLRRCLDGNRNMSSRSCS